MKIRLGVLREWGDFAAAVAVLLLILYFTIK